MINSKKICSVIVMVICFSFCIGTVSHAKTLISYKETVYGKPINGMGDIIDGAICRINSSGNLELNIYDYKMSKLSKAERKKLQGKNCKWYAKVTFDSKGKKKVVSRTAVNYKKFFHYVNGDRSYILKYTYDPYSKKVNNERKLIVTSKNGKIIKKINLNISKYLKNKNDSVYLKLEEVKGRKKVRLSYGKNYPYKTSGYGGIIEVNTVTGKVKKIVSSNDFNPKYYDGEYVYGKSFEPDSYLGNPEKVTFYMQSLKTGKTTKFTTEHIPYDWKNYVTLSPRYSFYKGKVMGVEPDGKVFYGTFNSKKFEQVGDISGCKFFKRYGPYGLMMKSRDEFYIAYNKIYDRDLEPDCTSPAWDNLYIAKYKKK